MEEYFQLAIDDTVRAWSLTIHRAFADGSPLDIWAYRGLAAVRDTRPVQFSIQSRGSRVDYNPTAFLATVVSNRLADYWQSVASQDVQRIPAIVGDDRENWEVVVVLKVIDCIDYARSKIDYYPPNHPEKPNQPRGIWRLVLDESRIGDHHLFHPLGWEVVTIVSEMVKVGMESMGITGAAFMPVTE